MVTGAAGCSHAALLACVNYFLPLLSSRNSAIICSRTRVCLGSMTRGLQNMEEEVHVVLTGLHEVRRGGVHVLT